MKTLILAVLATSLFFSANSQAEWTEVLADNEIETYVDFDRIRTSKGLVYIWSLTNHTEEPRSDGIVSATAYRKVNCETFQKATLTILEYASSMGEGSALHTVTVPEQWKSILPDTVGEYMIERACDFASQADL